MLINDVYVVINELSYMYYRHMWWLERFHAWRIMEVTIILFLC